MQEGFEMSPHDKPLYILLMGVQGAGKGVQARFLEHEFKIPHISTGNLFRAMEARQDELAITVQTIITTGGIVDDNITNAIVEDRLGQPDIIQGALFDGYPRTINQAKWLDNYLANLQSSLTAVLLLEIDLYVAFKRAFGRVQSKDGQSFNIYSDNQEIEWITVKDKDNGFPPKIEAFKVDSHEPLIRRLDDGDAASVIKRIDTYTEQTTPLIQYYSERDLIYRINADQPIDDVSLSILEAIEQGSEKITSGSIG